MPLLSSTQASKPKEKEVSNVSPPFAENLMRAGGVARKAETNVLSVAFFPTQPDQQLPEGSAGHRAFPKR